MQKTISKREISRRHGSTMGTEQCIKALMHYHAMTRGEATRYLGADDSAVAAYVAEGLGEN